MRKFIVSAVIAVSLAAPSVAFAGIGPKSLSRCDIAAWLGIVNVMACEGYEY